MQTRLNTIYFPNRAIFQAIAATSNDPDVASQEASLPPLSPIPGDLPDMTSIILPNYQPPASPVPLNPSQFPTQPTENLHTQIFTSAPPPPTPRIRVPKMLLAANNRNYSCVSAIVQLLRRVKSLQSDLISLCSLSTQQSTTSPPEIALHELTLLLCANGVKSFEYFRSSLLAAIPYLRLADSHRHVTLVAKNIMNLFPRQIKTSIGIVTSTRNRCANKTVEECDGVCMPPPQHPLINNYIADSAHQRTALLFTPYQF